MPIKVLKYTILILSCFAFNLVKAQYFGGNNDGYNSASSCDINLSGAGSVPITVSSIGGVPTFCNNGSEVYSVSVLTGTANTFVWTVPTGATIISSSNTLTTSSISVLFTTLGGNINVTASNGCSSVSSPALAVSSTACNLYLGGNYDGFSLGASCDVSLSGSSAGPLIINPIVGTNTFCANGAGNYSVSLISGSATSFVWSLPAGATIGWITNTLTSSSIIVQFSGAAGNISVTASNICSSASPTALAVNPVSCDVYFGGINDGFSLSPTCDVTLNGVASGAITLNPISGPPSFCANGAGSYSVSLLAGSATSFTWSLPSGATIVSIFNTLTSSTISVLFSAAGGNISVSATNGCSTDNSAPLAVTPTSCDLFFGGDNDGYSSFIFCSNTLNGGVVPAITVSAIIGPSVFCNNGSDVYSLNVLTGFATTYTWNGPSGSSLTSQNNSLTSSGTNFLFATTNGNIDVTATNGCTTASAISFPVTGTNCNQFFGGNNDGYSSAIFCANNLSGTVAPVVSLNAVTGPTSFCSNTVDGSYGVTLASGTSSIFVWNGPSGSSVAGISNSLTSSSINLSFAAAGGNITVSATDGCTSATSSPYSVTSVICNNTLGGNSDGFAFAPFCGLSLIGPAVGPLVLGPVTGSSTFCSNLGANYSVTVSSGFATNYIWVGPSGYNINSTISGGTRSTVNMQLTNTPGNVSVTVTDGCSTISATALPVTSVSCDFAFGGNNDGFATALLIDQPLPVELVDFSARLIKGKVYINWSTATEINNHFFTVQRSTDGVEFSQLEKVDGAGNSIERKFYQAIDHQPYKGISYYRLKQTDFDGRFTFPSKVIVIDFDSPDKSIQLFPNPAAETFFKFDSPDIVTTIEVKDMTGRTVLKYEPNIREGQVEIPTLSPGTYIIRFFTEKNPVQQQKMIKL
jgi:PKD-like domain/Secretion system C-terminal sorting domain